MALHFLSDLLLHVDHYLLQFMADHAAWTYLLLFTMVFCETAFIVIFFLPGDSLLFAAGSLTAQYHIINIHNLFLWLVLAATLGGLVNYHLGYYLGNHIVYSTHPFWQRLRHYVDQAHHFYQRHGGKAIFLARFIPIIRTFLPFIAGISRMPKNNFFIYNTLSAILWVTSFLYGSYLFGHIPVVQQHFHIIILTLVGLSFLLPCYHFASHYFLRNNKI